MIDWENRVLTNVETRLHQEYGPCKVVSIVNDTPPTFPTVCVSMLANHAIAEDLEIGDGENAVNCGIGVTAYSNKSKQDCKAMISVANKAMYNMGFKRGYGPITATSGVEAQNKYHVMLARYMRVIGSTETIEKFQ